MESEIRDGVLGRWGTLSDDEVKHAAQLVKQVESNGIETVRIYFSDPHGTLRGKTVTAHAFIDAFKSGVRAPSTLLLKDAAHQTVFPVWNSAAPSPMHGVGDVVMSPVPGTFRLLPWSPHSALMLANLWTTHGEPLAISSRGVLEKACARLAQHKLSARFGLEVEFQVYEVIDDALAHEDTTLPGRPPLTRALHQGYQYLSETRYGEVEPLLDKLRRAAEGMGMPVRSVEIEMGPSQFEFTFDAADPVSIADMAIMFRAMAKEVCHRERLLASFMTKPKLPNAFANGWHIHQSIVDANGKNLFVPSAREELTQHASAWIAGLLRHAAASCIATTPTVNGYKRYSAYQLAPNRIGWGHDNRGAMLRALFEPGQSSSRIENRVAESAVNPYFALAFQLIAGLDGLNRNLRAPSPLVDAYHDQAETLPATLSDAIDAFEQSELYREALGEEVVSYLVQLKRGEWQSYMSAVSEWEHAAYFTSL